MTDATLIRTRRASPATSGFALAFFWPDLSELLPYWFARPVCTAGLERGFSFQTRVDSDTRRRRLTSAHPRDDMLVQWYRDQLEKKLEASL